MITLNGKKFAENEKEFTESLFSGSGTCTGYVKINKKSISILDHQKKKIGVIANNVLGSATVINDKWWYSYGTPEIIGEYTSYSQEYDEVRTAMNKL